jgi:hypothetical protein
MPSVGHDINHYDSRNYMSREGERMTYNRKKIVSNIKGGR